MTKIKNFLCLIFIFTISLSTTSCELRGFSEPVTLNMEVPDGTVEYKAGWRAGCRSALSAGKQYTQGWVYGPDHGTGAYQQHPDFYAGWSHAWFTCVIHAVTFTSRPNNQGGPLK